ncbi:MAG: DUF3332 domain-containing protein [bacterium]|nr:DUF3332 domain-containing protein [bacterium]
MQALKKMVRNRLFALLLLALSVVPLSGCYGHFPLTRAIYQANGSVGGEIQGDSTQKKIAQSAVMWVFVIIPVYGIGAIGDALVFNVVEFWTGETVQIGQAQPGATLAQQPAPVSVKVVEAGRR